MQKGTNDIVTQTLTNDTGLVLAEAPTAPAVRFATPDAFRRQERFWKEVRQRILERRPAAAAQTDRLY